jgi:hypothetical protein
MRTFNAFGIWLPGTVTQGITICYMSFFKAALLFLLINIAASLRVHLRMIGEHRTSNESKAEEVAFKTPSLCNVVMIRDPRNLIKSAGALSVFKLR